MSLDIYLLNGEKIKLELASAYEKTEDILEVFIKTLFYDCKVSLEYWSGHLGCSKRAKQIVFNYIFSFHMAKLCVPSGHLYIIRYFEVLIRRISEFLFLFSKKLMKNIKLNENFTYYFGLFLIKNDQNEVLYRKYLNVVRFLAVKSQKN